MRVHTDRMRQLRRGPADDAGGVHPAGLGWAGLLRHKQRRWLQRARVSRPAGRRSPGELQLNGVRRQHRRGMPAGAAVHVAVQRGCHRLQERVLGVQHRPVLLPGRLRQPQHLQTHQLLAVLQECMPSGV